MYAGQRGPAKLISASFKGYTSRTFASSTVVGIQTRCKRDPIVHHLGTEDDRVGQCIDFRKNSINVVQFQTMINCTNSPFESPAPQDNTRTSETTTVGLGNFDGGFHVWWCVRKQVSEGFDAPAAGCLHPSTTLRLERQVAPCKCGWWVSLTREENLHMAAVRLY